MSNDPLEKLYDDPAIVRAMEVLTKHGITGAEYEKLIAQDSKLSNDGYLS